VPFKKAMVGSLSSVTIAPSLLFGRNYHQTLKSTGMGHFVANLRRKGLTDVSRILTQSVRDIRLSYANEIVPLSSAV